MSSALHLKSFSENTTDADDIVLSLDIPSGSRRVVVFDASQQIIENFTIEDGVLILDGSPTLPGIGHNGPPAPLTPHEVRTYLADAKAPLITRKNALLEGVARFVAAHPKISDEETQSKAGDFVKQIQAHIKIIEDNRTPAKKPFLEGGRAVDAFFKDISDPLTVGLNQVRAPMTVYAQEQETIRRAEAQRVAEAAAARAAATAEALAQQQREEAAREEARRQAEYVPPPPVDEPPPVTLDDAIAAAQEAEKLAKEAAVRPADLSRTRGDMGSVSSLRENVEVELINLDLVPREFLVFDAAKAKKAAQAGRTEIPGVKITRGTHIAIR